MNKLSVAHSAPMEFLLGDPVVTKSIARAFPQVELVLLQAQRDIVTEENVANAGHDVLAMKRLSEILTMFKLKGDILIKQEEQKTK